MKLPTLQPPKNRRKQFQPADPTSHCTIAQIQKEGIAGAQTCLIIARPQVAGFNDNSWIPGTNRDIDLFTDFWTSEQYIQYISGNFNLRYHKWPCIYIYIKGDTFFQNHNL